MKLLWMSTFCLVLHSCSEQTDKLIRNTETNLKSTKNVSYHVDNLTIEGHAVGDTILTTTYAFFEKSETDTILGYNFSIKSSLIHPRFLIPIVLRDHYNGSELIWTLESEMRNDHTITELKEIEKTVLKNKVNGHLPMLLDLLRRNGYVQTSIVERNLDGNDCVQINYLGADSINYQLFIDRKKRIPALLRIVFNEEQPLIQEYYYTEFLCSDRTQFPAINESLDDTHKSELLPIGVGDTIPDWQLETIEGIPYDFRTQKGKTSVIFISGISCGYCYLQIPLINNLYKQYYDHSGIEIVSIYPYDKKERLKIYKQEKEISYPILYNSFSNRADRLNFMTNLQFPIPTVMIITRENQVGWIRTGINKAYLNEYERELENQIKNYAHNKGGS